MGPKDGLQLGNEKEFRRLVIELDSEAVVKVMNESYDYSDFFITLTSNCKYLVSAFKEVIFTQGKGICMSISLRILTKQGIEKRRSLKFPQMACWSSRSLTPAVPNLEESNNVCI